jgi:hypothetical protein
LWKEHFIIDNTILIATRDNYVPINGKNYTDGSRKDTSDLYTGFPYERGKCGGAEVVTLLDQWRLRNEMLIHNANFVPLKIRESFHSCQIRAATLGIPPYIILTGNSTDSDGNVVHKLGGLAVKVFISSTFQPTIPYKYTAIKWIFLCPQHVARMEKFMHTYQLPVWLAMVTVFLLTAILWRGLANGGTVL